MLLPDLSEWQQNANIAGIRKQTPAIICRVGYGHDHLDRLINHWRPQCVAQQFQFIGLYHYLVGSQDPVAQAQVFCSWVGKLNSGEIPMLDLEEGGGNQQRRAQDWLDYVDRYFGLTTRLLSQRSWLYSGESFAHTSGLTPIFNSLRRTWVAAYGDTEPKLPHTLWQCTNGAIGKYRTSWSGAGFCDTNYTKSTVAELSMTAWHPDISQQPDKPKETNWYPNVVRNLSVHPGKTSAEFTFDAPSGFLGSPPVPEPGVTEYEIAVTHRGSTANLPSYPRYPRKDTNPEVHQVGSLPNGDLTGWVRAIVKYQGNDISGPWSTVNFTLPK